MYDFNMCKNKLVRQSHTVQNGFCGERKMNIQQQQTQSTNGTRLESNSGHIDERIRALSTVPSLLSKKTTGNHTRIKILLPEANSGDPVQTPQYHFLWFPCSSLLHLQFQQQDQGNNL